MLEFKKVCTQCETERSVGSFHKRTISLDGLALVCKHCKREANRKYREENKEKIKLDKQIYYEQNKDKINQERKRERTVNREAVRQKEKDYWLKNKDKKAEKDRKYRENHEEQCKEKSRKYRETHKEEIKLKKQKDYENHKQKVLEKSRKYRQTHKKERNENEGLRRKFDINFRLSGILRTRLAKAIKGNFKSGSAVKDLGCSIQDFKLWLEQQFQIGMSWENYGSTGWHIDHIVPLNSFDLEDRNQLKKACNWFNFQPMWAEENLSKGAKIEY
jgi:hypothetical protein